MNYRLVPDRPVHRSVRKIAVSQIADLLEEHGNATSPVAVHEARKAIKRLRALLSLVREGLDGDDLQREKARLRGVAGLLAGARDAHVMLETAISLRDAGVPRACQATAEALIARLEQQRDEAAAALSAGEKRLPVAAFQEAQEALDDLPLSQLDMGQVLDGFTRTYRRGRALQLAACREGAEEETFHDLRKEVQQHWRHLQLLSKAWPKAMRPQIALSHELGETLGRDHDIAVLAAFVRDNAQGLGNAKGIDTYLRLCIKVQEKLRARASLLARRLYAEKPKAIRARIHAWWETAAELAKDDKAARHANGKAATLSG